jgi:gluconokinase
MVPSVIIVMGVSGSGKTTVASLLAQRLRWRFVEGDSLHPAANVAKMSEGIPLTDEDRWPWLDAIAAWIDAARASGEPCIVTCSALKRAYRERLVAGHDDARFVYLKGELRLVTQRMAVRTGHYMPLSLLQSQFDTLEEPGSEENPLVVPIEASPEEIVASIVANLRLDRGLVHDPQ